MTLAFFDFDGTITKHDTFIEFAKFSLGKKRLYSAILRNCVNLVMWKIGIISNSEAKQRLFTTLFREKNHDWFKAQGVRFKEKINRDLNADVMKILNRHRTDGHRVVIVSASIYEWIWPWASDNGIDAVICTEIEVNNFGKITGNFRTPNCHGCEKAIRIKAMFPDIENCESWGYGDSDGDRQMLDLVTHPIRVK